MDSRRPKTRTSHRAIRVIDLPEGFADRKAIRQHFSQFAHVTRVSSDDKFQSAQVHFRTAEDARNAAKNGEIWEDELLTIVGPSENLRNFSDEGLTSYEDLDLELLDSDENFLFGESPKFEDRSRDLFKIEDKISKKVKSTRSVMMDHLGAPSNPTKIKRSTLVSTDIVKPEYFDASPKIIRKLDNLVEKRASKRSVSSKSDSFSKEKKVKSSPKSTSPKGFKSLVGKNLKDKLFILNERDKWLKKCLAKTGATKSTLKGTCPDMCPEKERIMREYRSLVSIFETNEESKGLVPELAIKEYSRSSADQEEPLPHELRPGPVLTMTMSYLINNVIPEIDNQNLKESVSEWFDFCWDRLRGIRKDITQQQLCDVSIITIIEQCARFHIACYDRLYGLDMKIFDEKINRENIMNCLSSLNQMYDSLSRSSDICLNEGEFKAYQILLQLNSSDILWEFQNFPPHIQKSNDIKTAVKAYLLFSSRSYSQFFDLAEKTTYLNSCLLQTYFPVIRESALTIIIKAYSPPIKTVSFNADFFKQSFRIDDAELQSFCNNFGIEFVGESNEILLSREEISSKDLNFSFANSSFIVVNKRKALSFVVVNSDTLPTYTSHQVHNSFDEDGSLKKIAYQAIDQEMKLKQDFNFSYRPLLDQSEIKYDSDSDVQIISDDEGCDDNMEGDHASKNNVPSYVVEIDDEEKDCTDDSGQLVKRSSNFGKDGEQELQEARRRLIENLEKEKHLEALIQKEKQWKIKEEEQQRKLKLQKEEEKQKEALRRMEEMKQERKRKMEEEIKMKQRIEEEEKQRILKMEEEIQRKIDEEKERKRRIVEEQQRLLAERMQQEKLALEQEKMRREEMERQRRICEEEERLRKLREEERRVREEQERLRKIREEEERKEEEVRKKRMEEVERQRKLKEEIRRQLLMKEKAEELNILKNYLSQRLKAISVRHYARVWRKKIETIRQSNINFPAMVRLSVDENLALWGTVGNQNSVPPLRTCERFNRLKSTQKVISKLNQSKLKIEYIGDILAESIVKNNLKLKKSLVKFVFCKLVFSFPENECFDGDFTNLMKKCLSQGLLPKDCNFSEGFSIITSQSIPVFTSINVIENSNSIKNCRGMNGLVVFSSKEIHSELKTQICQMLSLLNCSVPIPLIIVSIDDDFNSIDLKDFLDQLKKDKILIHWAIYSWKSWSIFVKEFFSVISKFTVASVDISVNSFCSLLKNLMDEFFSTVEAAPPNSVIHLYNQFLTKVENYLINVKYQDIPLEFKSLLVKSCNHVVSSETANLTNHSRHLKILFNSLTLMTFNDWPPKNVGDLLKILKSYCKTNTLLFSQIVRLLELSDEDNSNFELLLKRVSWANVIELLAQDQLEKSKQSDNNVFVVYRMRDLLELVQD